MSRQKKSALLDPRFKAVLYIASALLWASGAAHYFLAEGHPAGSTLLKIHGAFAMGFLILFGMLLAEHIPAGWTVRETQRGGGVLVGITTVLTITGWFLYYIGTETVRHAASLIHSLIGLLSPLVLVAHVRWRIKNPLAKPHGHSKI